MHVPGAAIPGPTPQADDGFLNRWLALHVFLEDLSELGPAAGVCAIRSGKRLVPRSARRQLAGIATNDCHEVSQMGQDR